MFDISAKIAHRIPLSLRIIAARPPETGKRAPAPTLQRHNHPTVNYEIALRNVLKEMKIKGWRKDVASSALVSQQNQLF
jgi:hypothetical protein